MTTVPHHEEIRHRYEEELEAIKREAVLIASLVLENARRAFEALLESRLELADQVIDADEEVNRRSKDLERRIFELMARQQPVAGDLRFLVSATRIAYELERTGDLVVNCAQSLRRLGGLDITPHMHGLLARIAEAGAAVFAESLNALADMDAELGTAIESHDDVVDELVGEIYQGLGQEGDRSGLDTAIQLSRIARYIERIADHGVNLGQHVTYIVTAVFPGDRKAAD